MQCDTIMPCNAFQFDDGICDLAFLDRDLFYDVHEEYNMTVYLNGKYKLRYHCSACSVAHLLNGLHVESILWL